MNKLKKKYIAEFVYGATDGTVTTFAIVSGVLGAALSPAIILVLGFANLLADGFSMAASNYLSEKSDQAVGADDFKKPIKTALITFVSFITIGIIPLISFVFATFSNFFKENQFEISIIFTALAFVIIGSVRGKVTNQNKFMSALETLFVGGVAAVISYYVGHLLRAIVG